MNRVVLCGRLTARPKCSYTPTGVAIAHFNLLVSHEGNGEVALIIPCCAQRVVAQELSDWGERGYRVNLDGHLRCLADTPVTAGFTPMCVLVESAYFVDDVRDPALPADRLPVTESAAASGNPGG